MQLYPYQEQVLQLIQEGKNVILQAPTGAGKTLAALMPYLTAQGEGERFPRKCLYTVPLRTLANQFVDVAKNLISEGNGIAPASLRVAIQTGERPEDPRFEANLIFATIDQVLSSFLNMPYSLSRKQANVNAGAVAASYLVFDEFHLFDPIATLPTTLEMLRILHEVTPFILMTATFSGHLLETLAKWLGAAVVPASGEERQAMLELPVEKTKKRYYHWVDEQLTAEAILHYHRNRTLVVCNTVGRAQEIYHSLRAHPGLGETEVILLHSRYLPEDRLAREERLRQTFGKEANRIEGSIIAVATQVVEVGLDISAQVLHTELAPANAILQRAGRCARFKDETGTVYVYPVESPLPYQGQQETIDLTAEWLRAQNGAVLTFLGEQAWIDCAHSPIDKKLLEGLMATHSEHRSRMEAALRGDEARAGELIRKVISQNLTISAEPDRLLNAPFAAPMWALHPGMLQGAARKWLEDNRHSPPLEERLKRLEEVDTNEEGYAVKYRWAPVTQPQELRAAPLLAIHPTLATYDPDEGLVLDRGGDFVAERHLEEQAAPQAPAGLAWKTRYRLESYVEHVQAVYRAFRAQVWPDLSYAARRLEQRAGWPPGSITLAAALVVLLHDVGKLTNDWQGWVRQWQALVGRPLPPGMLAAHTDYDSEDPHCQNAEQQMGRRPSHATEGAVAVAPLLAGCFRDHQALFRACFSAIARHHGAFTANFRAYRLANGAKQAIHQALRQAQDALNNRLPRIELRHQEDPHKTPIKHCLVDASENNELLAYMLVVRALRYADQLGTAWAGEAQGAATAAEED